MKKFLLTGFLFSAIFLGLTFLVDCLEVSDDYIIYKTVHTSFKKIAWDLNMIHHHPEKISNNNIFMGSSLMQGGLSDSTLNANGVPSLNFGINGTGNEVALFFLEKILRYHPRKIYLHLFKNDKTGLHPMTPLLYTPISILKSGQSLNISFLEFLLKRVYFIVDYGFWKLCDTRKMQPGFYSDYGSIYNDGVAFTPKQYIEIKKMTDEYFESFSLDRNNFIKKSEQGKSRLYLKILRYRRILIHFFQNLDFIYNCKSQTEFVSRAFILCKKNNLEVNRLYIPLVADAKINKDFDETFYIPRKDKNIVSLRNFTFLDSVIYWADKAHLNKKGAILFTEELLQHKVIKP